ADVDQFLEDARIAPETFARIITRTDVRNPLPHSEALLTITSELSLAPSNVLMISDTDVNLRSARAAQMATAGVLCGLGKDRDLRDADLVVSDVSELVEWL
ncbi:MAG: HAD family hydrolase, partial [Caldilineaceae bacterium]|nr:HAD family hydrolase [Caldilineaceae bacterium]